MATPGTSRPRDHRGEWWASLRRVEAHIAAHGYPRQRDIADDGWRPGKWLAKQKERWGRLASEQREALLGLPGFSLDARAAHFEEMVAAYERARESHEANGLDKNWVFDDLSLGQWLHDLTRGRITLTDARVARLREAGIFPKASGGTDHG